MIETVVDGYGSQAPRRLRIGIVSAILHHSFGGPPAVIKQHWETLSLHHNVTVWGTARPEHMEEVKRTFPNSRLFETTWPNRWFRAKGFESALRREIEGYDVLHLHMVWDHPIMVAAKLAYKAGRPYIVTPHGTFMNPSRYDAPWKRIYRVLIANRMLERATYVQVLTAAEREACSKARISSPLVVIPNGLSQSAFLNDTLPSNLPHDWECERDAPFFVCISRLAPGKGIDLLIEAWAQARQNSALKSWKLIVAGPDYRHFRATLEDRILALNIADSVRLVGQVSGTLKSELLMCGQAFVQPSESEALSMSLLEAMAAGMPCLYTQGCNLPDLAVSGGGIEVAAAVADLQAGLIKVATLAPEERRRMGRHARTLAEARFTNEVVGRELEKMYERAVGRHTVSVDIQKVERPKGGSGAPEFRP